MTLPLRDNDGNLPDKNENGHPLFYITEEGMDICANCAEVHGEVVGFSDPSIWIITDAEVNWEDNSKYCACCRKKLDCVYPQPPVPYSIPGDYYTEDFVSFYENGKLAFQVPPGVLWWDYVKNKMEDVAYWKPTWLVNTHIYPLL